MSHTVGMLFDTHVYEGPRRSDSSEADTKSAIDQLNSVGCDFTIHGGDIRPLGSVTSQNIVDWGNWGGDDNPYYEADFPYVKSILDDRLDSSYEIVRGNHDRPEPVLREYFPVGSFSPSDDLDRNGGWWGVKEYDGVRYVYLDSNPTEGWHVEEQGGNYITAPQLSMLDRLAEADSSIPTVVFCHSPLARMSVGGDWQTGRNTTYFLVQNYPSVQSRLEAMNTILVVFGDKHDTNIRTQDSINGVAYNQADHLGGGLSGDVRWLNVDTVNNTATVRYYDTSDGSTGNYTQISW